MDSRHPFSWLNWASWLLASLVQRTRELTGVLTGQGEEGREGRDLGVCVSLRGDRLGHRVSGSIGQAQVTAALSLPCWPLPSTAVSPGVAPQLAKPLSPRASVSQLCSPSTDISVSFDDRVTIRELSQVGARPAAGQQ